MVAVGKVGQSRKSALYRIEPPCHKGVATVDIPVKPCKGSRPVCCGKQLGGFFYAQRTPHSQRHTPTLTTAGLHPRST